MAGFITTVMLPLLNRRDQVEVEQIHEYIRSVTKNQKVLLITGKRPTIRDRDLKKSNRLEVLDEKDCESHIPFPGKQFEVVIADSVLTGGEEDLLFLLEVKRVLKNNGSFLAPVYVEGRPPIWWRPILKLMDVFLFPTHIQQNTASYLAFLKNQGWVLKDCRIFDTIYPMACPLAKDSGKGQVTT